MIYAKDNPYFDGVAFMEPIDNVTCDVDLVYLDSLQFENDKVRRFRYFVFAAKGVWRSRETTIYPAVVEYCVNNKLGRYVTRAPKVPCELSDEHYSKNGWAIHARDFWGSTRLPLADLSKLIGLDAATIVELSQKGDATVLPDEIREKMTEQDADVPTETLPVRRPQPFAIRVGETAAGLIDVLLETFGRMGKKTGGERTKPSEVDMAAPAPAPAPGRPPVTVEDPYITPKAIKNYEAEIFLTSEDARFEHKKPLGVACMCDVDGTLEQGDIKDVLEARSVIRRFNKALAGASPTGKIEKRMIECFDVTFRKSLAQEGFHWLYDNIAAWARENAAPVAFVTHYEQYAADMSATRSPHAHVMAFRPDMDSPSLHDHLEALSHEDR